MSHVAIFYTLSLLKVKVCSTAVMNSSLCRSISFLVKRSTPQICVCVHSSPLACMRVMLGMPWPIDCTDGSFETFSRVTWEGLLPREREVVAFVDNSFRPSSTNGKEVEFLDVNQKLSRILTGSCDDFVLRVTNCHSPWRTTCPTIVGSNKMVVRYYPGDAGGTPGRYRLRCNPCCFCCWLVYHQK